MAGVEAEHIHLWIGRDSAAVHKTAGDDMAGGAAVIPEGVVNRPQMHVLRGAIASAVAGAEINGG